MLVLEIALGVALALAFWRAWPFILLLCLIVGALVFSQLRTNPPPVAPIAGVDVVIGLGGVMAVMLPVVGLLVWRDRRRVKRNLNATVRQEGGAADERGINV